MAMLYEQMYSTNSLTRTNVRSFVDRLTRGILGPFGDRGNPIRVSADIADVSLELRTAVPLCLILNEALTNVAKYAYPENRGGEVRIAMHLDNGTVCLSIADDGVGLPPEFSIDHAKSMGMRLIRILADQIDASLSIESVHGTTIRLAFALDDDDSVSP